MPFLRLLRDWRRYKKGRVIEPAGGMAEILIRRKIAEPFEPDRSLAAPPITDAAPAPHKQRRKKS